MKSRLTLIFMLLAGIFWSFATIAQPLIYKAETVITCPGQNVHVFIPITLQNFNSVAAFDLELNFDTNAVTYVGASNINQALATNGLLVQFGGGPKWAVSYLPNDTISVPDDTLCVLEFIYKNNWTELHWNDTLCGFVNYSFNTIPSTPVHGLIGITGPFILTQPITSTTPSGNNTQFMVSGTNIDFYQWQSSTDGITYSDLSNTGFYSNVTTATLDLTAVNPSIDGTWYRCKTTGICGDQYSNGAKLLVVSTTPVHTFAGQNVFCQGMIYVPIKVTDLYSVRDFTLSVNINIPATIPDVLIYNSIQNQNPDLIGTFNVTPSDSNVLIEFTGDITHTANFGNGKLFDLVFVANTGVTQFNWDLSQCEYLSPANSPLFVTFQDDNFTIIPLPSMPLTVVGPTSICNNGGTYTYTTPVNPTYISYIWAISPPEAGTLVAAANTCQIVYAPSFSGPTTITVKGSNSCGNSNPNAIFPIISIPTPVNLGTMNDVCLNADPVTLSGGTPPMGSYSGPGVYNGAFYADSVGVGTTMITYTFVNPFNCASADSTSITVLPLPTVTFSVIPQAVCYNWAPFFLSGGSPAGGTYTGPGVSGSGIFQPGFGLVGDQNLKYTITGANGCKNAAFSSIHVDACVGVDNQDKGLNFNVQPNPNNGLFEVNINNLEKDAVLSIYNDLGQQVYSENLSPAATGNHKVDLSNQPQGMYFLMLNCQGNVLVDKIILK